MIWRTETRRETETTFLWIYSFVDLALEACKVLHNYIKLNQKEKIATPKICEQNRTIKVDLIALPCREEIF